MKNSPLSNMQMQNIENLREERDRLLDENAKMRASDRAGTPAGGDRPGDGNALKYLRSKVSTIDSFLNRV